MAALDALLARPEEERESYLQTLMATQPDLHARIKTLLEADQIAAANNFLEPDAMQQDLAALPTLAAGLQLGPYQILKPLGAGGMGEVWLARRDDGLYEGEVAIKILHPQFSSGVMRDRFRREAQLLGRLTHPNIARLLDAGIANNMVYLVLEYVAGKPIDQWCDERQLTIKERLTLFIALCDAVAHAHANLIVHRDLKPNNVLVDMTGQVKLLDFGIGKLIEHDPVAPSTVAPAELTQLSGRIFTAGYAAPEQIHGAAITTAADVFSLGAILYLILCGQRPFTADSVAATENAVLNVDPPPLNHVARKAIASTLTARATSARKLQSELAGDLEHIVNRALRKDSSQRYNSVQALIDDVRCHLSQLPVQARVGSRGYLLRRFVQRHRVAVMATWGVVLSLVMGISGIVWNSHLAREQARIATLESQKANAVKEFLLKIFDHNNINHPEGAQARKTTAEELLDIASDDLLQEQEELLPIDFEIRIELLSILGNLNHKLEKMDRAEALQLKQVELYRQFLGKSNRRTITAQLNLAIVLNYLQKYEEMKTIIEDSIEQLELTGAHVSKERAFAEMMLGEYAYLQAGPEDSQAAEHFRAAIEILEQLPPTRNTVEAYTRYSSVLHYMSNYSEAAAAASRAIELATDLFGAESFEVAAAYTSATYAFASLEQFDTAAQYGQKAIELNEHQNGTDAVNTFWSRMAYAEVLQAQGENLAAAREIEQALNAYAVRNQSHLNPTQYARQTFALALQDIGDFEGAVRVLDMALAIPSISVDPGLVMLLNLQMASLQLAMGDAGTAHRFAQQALTSVSLDGATADVNTQKLLLLQVEILAALQQHEQAELAMTYAMQRIEKPSRAIQYQSALTKIAIDFYQKKYQNTITATQNLLRELSEDASPQRWWIQTDAAYRILAQAQAALGNKKESCHSLENAIALRNANALTTDPRLQQTRELFSACL